MQAVMLTSVIVELWHHSRLLRCCYLCWLYSWRGYLLCIQYREDVFTSCCGLCRFWKLKCCDLLSCCDLSRAFFSLVLYSNKKFHCLIPEGQKVSLLQVFNLGLVIVAEQLSWTWSRVLMSSQKPENHQPHLLKLI